MILATVLGVAIPIKIWNSARIEHRLAEQEKLLMAARVEALANQINPHFLFNTLTSITSLIRSQPETARVLIVKLSGLLRRLLRSQEHFVTLREELAAVDEYLDIERVRFGPSLVVDKRIDENSLSIIVPSMILQPLVENSIKHGLSRKVGEGRITIHASRRAGHAVIEVIDNGVGMPPERLDAAGQRGIGLRNVNERLRVIYGANYALHLQSVPGEGHPRAHRDSGTGRADARSPHEPCRHFAPWSSTTNNWPATSCASCSNEAGEVEIVGQAGDGPAALRMAGELRPDLLFLDVQMPGLTGFEVARRLLQTELLPQLVFVTAFDQYAIDAFSVNAVDYLLKPVDNGRLEQTLDRARRRLRLRAGRAHAPGAGRSRKGHRGRPGPPGTARSAGHPRRANASCSSRPTRSSSPRWSTKP